MTTIHIIACGDTGAHWDGSGPSIGVNDCWKWGNPVDFLVLLNTPGQFQPSRLEVIKASKPKKLFTNLPSQWSPYFDTIEQIGLRRWSSGDPFKRGTLYHASTSPMVAISLAAMWGAEEIVLWGVDLVNHQRYGRDGSGHVMEMKRYQSFFVAMRNAGINVLIGARGTAFDNILPVWTKEKKSNERVYTSV